jgi:PKD repeat protein
MPYLTYTWDFDDGTTSEESLHTHTYKKPGKFRVTLKVTDDDGSIGEAIVEVKVTEYNPNIDIEPESQDDSGIILVASIANIIIIIILIILIFIYLRGWPPKKANNIIDETKHKSEDEKLQVNSTIPDMGVTDQSRNQIFGTQQPTTYPLPPDNYFQPPTTYPPPTKY